MPSEVRFADPNFGVDDHIQIMSQGYQYISEAQVQYEGSFFCNGITQDPCNDPGCRFPRHRKRHGMVQLRGYMNHWYCAARFVKTGTHHDWLEEMGGSALSDCRHLAYPYCACNATMRIKVM